MANLVAIAYDDLDTAKKMTGELGTLAKEHALELQDVVIVEHKEGGKIKLHQPSAITGGALGGALWGGLIGMIFFVPLFGMAMGGAMGAAGGAMTDYGIDNDFMKQLGNKLPEGGAAVFVLVEQATADKVVPEISKFGGQVIQSSLSDEQEAALQTALDQGAPA